MQGQFWSQRVLTWAEPAADFHGWVPLSILAGQVFIISFEHVAFNTQILYDTA